MSRLTASIAHVPWWRYSLLLRWSASAHAAATTDASSASSSHPSRGRRYIAPRASDDGVDLVLLGFGDEAAGRSRLLILWSSGDDLGRSGLDGGLLIEGGRYSLGDDVRVLRDQVIILVIC